MNIHDETHYCWSQCCDLGPHPCICGNDCPPDRFPLTLDELRDWWLSGYHEGYETEEAKALFDRWLAEHEEQIRYIERSIVAEQIHDEGLLAVEGTGPVSDMARAAYKHAARIAREVGAK